MALLRQFSLVLLLSCLVVLGQAEDQSEARNINNQDLANLIPALTKSLKFLSMKTTTAKPEIPSPPHVHIKPVYIYAPPKEDRPSHHYPSYPHYAAYPYPLTHHHYGPEEPEKPQKPKPEKPHKTKPEVPPTHLEEPEFIITGKPHHSQAPHDAHYPHLPPYGYYPIPYPPFYPPSHSGSSQNYPHFVIINPSGSGHHDHHHDINPYHRPQSVRPFSEDEEFAENIEHDYQTNENEGGARIVSLDSLDTNDAEAITTKDVKLPYNFIMGEILPRKSIADQVALVYMRNYKQARQFKE